MTTPRKRDSKSPREHKLAAGRAAQERAAREGAAKSAGEVPDSAKDAPEPRSVARRPLWASLLLVGLFVGGTLVVFTPRYETNDDVGMNASVAGRLGFSRPDEHILHSSVLIGLALKKCYTVFPSVPWYGGYLFLTAALSLAAICYVCLSQPGSEWNWLLIATFLLVAGIPFLVELQFTRVASVAALAGMLLLAGSVRAERIGWQTGLAIPFLLAACLIRFHAFLLICVVVSPMIAWMFWRTRRQISARVPCLVLMACLAVGFGAHRFDVWYYDRDANWRGFHHLNALLSEFVDYGRVDYTPETAPVIASVGWLPIDYLMLQNWAFLDRERYNVHTLQAILDGSASRGWKPTKPLLDLFSSLLQDGELLGLWAFGAACLAILAIDKSARFVPLACFCVSAVVCILLYEYMGLPPRVYCPAFAACSITPILLSAGPRSFGRHGPWTESTLARRTILPLFVGLFVWRGISMWQSNVEFRADHAQAALMMQELAPRSNQLFVVWGSSFPYQYVVLPLDGDSMPRDFNVLGLDKRALTPPTRLLMDEFGVTDLMSIARRGDGTYLICDRWPANMLRVYLEAHYGVKVVYYLRYSNPMLGAGAVWQIKIEGTVPRPS
jgi:hypothetical protein